MQFTNMLTQLIQSGHRIPAPYLGNQNQAPQPFRQLVQAQANPLPQLQSQNLQLGQTGRTLQLNMGQNLAQSKLQASVKNQLSQMTTKLSRTTVVYIHRHPVQSQMELHLRNFMLRQGAQMNIQLAPGQAEPVDKSGLVLLSFLAIDKPFEKEKHKPRKSGYYFPLNFKFAWEREDEARDEEARQEQKSGSQEAATP